MEPHEHVRLLEAHDVGGHGWAADAAMDGGHLGHLERGLLERVPSRAAS
jgi:hypothetical protein